MVRERPSGEAIILVIPMAREYIAGLSSVMASIRRVYEDRETAALNMIYSAFYHYSAWLTKGAPVGVHVASASTPNAPATYFGTDAHFKVLKLRAVNIELDLLTGTDIRQSTEPAHFPVRHDVQPLVPTWRYLSGAEFNRSRAAASDNRRHHFATGAPIDSVGTNPFSLFWS